MSDSQADYQLDDRLHDLLDAWYDQVAVGRHPEPAELCRHCPEMLFPLTQAIRQLQQMDGVLESPEPAPAAPAAPLPDRIGPFEVLSELGRGGMGVVYLCRQRGTNREIAVKVLQPLSDSEEDSGRFRREMLAAGAITDPGVVHIYDAGIDESGPIRHRWIAMEHVRGVHLNRYVLQQKLDAEQIIALLQKICQSVAALHQKGIIHQDLKPSNILVDSSGRPQILDFGIAATLEQEGEVQLENSPLTFGTLPYLPPEAVDAEEENTDVRTDIYALGVILFELLTNNAMRSWHETTKVLQKATNFESRHEWIALETAGLPHDLRQVVLKAVHPDRNQRYTSVDALSADLQRFIDGYPVEAAGVRQWQRALKWCRRNRLAALAGVMMMIVLTGWTMSVFLYEHRNSLTASNLRQKEDELQREQWRLDAGLGNHELLKTQSYVDSDPNFALERLQEIRNSRVDADNCLALNLLLKRAQWLVHEFSDAPRDLVDLTFSDDSGHLIAHSPGSGTFSWSLSASRHARQLSSAPDQVLLGCSPDARFQLLKSSADHGLTLLAPQGALQFELSHDEDRIRCGDVSPDGMHAALGTDTGKIVVVSLDDLHEHVRLETDQKIAWLSWDTEDRIVTCTPAATFRVLNTASWTLEQERHLQETNPQLERFIHFDYDRSMSFGECLLLVQRSDNAFTFSPARQPPLNRQHFSGFNPHSGHLVPPDSMLLATDRFVSLSDAYTQEKRWVMRQSASVTATGVSADGGLVAIATEAGFVGVYRTSPGPWSDIVEPQGEDGLPLEITSCAVQRAANPLLLGTKQGGLVVWDAVRDCVIHQFSLSTQPIGKITAFVSDEENFSACVSTREGLVAVSLNAGKLASRHKICAEGTRTHHAAFSGNGSSCVVAMPNAHPRIIDLKTLESIPLENSHVDVTAVAFDPGARHWLLGGRDGSLMRRSLSGDIISLIQAHEQEITAILLIKDRVLTVSRDNRLIEWSRTGQHVAERREHRYAIKCMAVSKSAGTLATADRAGNICLWDPLTLDLRLTVAETDVAIDTLHYLEDDCLVSRSTGTRELRFWGNRPSDPD